MASIHVVDYIIFSLTVVFSFAIGLYYACASDKNKTTEDYLLANRKMNLIPVAISFMASFFSAISILGNSSEIYYYGMEYWFVVLGIFTGAMIVSITYVPLLNPLKLTSIHQYLLLRYRSKIPVYMGLCLQCVALSLINGVVLFGQAIVLESFANIPVWVSILGTGFVATLYTTIGGYQAVIWSDVFQTVIMAIGLVTINIVGTIKVGSPAKVWEIYANEGKLNLNWSFTPFERSTMWTFTLGAVPVAIMFKSCQQVSAQRYCSLPSVKQAQKSIFIASVPQFVLISLTCISGVVTFAYFTSIGCDPYRDGQISNTNQIIPHFIKEVINYPTIPGLFMACITCGTFSNLSSSFNSISAMVWQDLLNDKTKGRKLTEKTKTLITKVISFIAGSFSTAAAFIVSEIGGTLIQVVFTVSTAALAPVFVFVTLGALTVRATWKSAAVGAIVAPIIIIYLNIGNKLSGANVPILDTTVINCTKPVSPPLYTASGGYFNESEGVTYDNSVQFRDIVEDLGENIGNMSKSHQPGGDVEVEKVTQKKPVFILYKISYILISPVGAAFGLVFGLIFSFIPGFKNKEKVEDKYIFPFIVYIMRKSGYQGFKEQSSGMYVIEEKQNGIEEMGSRELKIINMMKIKS